jgi:hypothetical protein
MWRVGWKSLQYERNIVNMLGIGNELTEATGCSVDAATGAATAPSDQPIRAGKKWRTSDYSLNGLLDEPEPSTP